MAQNYKIKRNQRKRFEAWEISAANHWPDKMEKNLLGWHEIDMAMDYTACIQLNLMCTMYVWVKTVDGSRGKGFYTPRMTEDLKTMAWS